MSRSRFLDVLSFPGGGGGGGADRNSGMRAERNAGGMTRMQPPSSHLWMGTSLVLYVILLKWFPLAPPSFPRSGRHISALGAHGTTFNGLAKCSNNPSLGLGLYSDGDTEALGELSRLTAFVSGANMHARSERLRSEDK